jgi:hypothetical protein
MGNQAKHRPRSREGNIMTNRHSSAMKKIYNELFPLQTLSYIFKHNFYHTSRLSFSKYLKNSGASQETLELKDQIDRDVNRVIL